MTDTRRLVVGNWKMELSHTASCEVARSISKLLIGVELSQTDVAICPSFLQIPAVMHEFADHSVVRVGAQNVHFEKRGAWTGEVSVDQLKPFVDMCIVGHSERRKLVSETDEQVRGKTNLLLTERLTAIVCLGETADERDQGQAIARVTEQSKAIFDYIHGSDLSRLVVAYEPIWAIGTGSVCDPADASSMMLLIRRIAVEKFGRDAADRLRILYGGSVSSDNVKACVSEPGIDGVLVGGASIHPGDFVNIVKTVEEVSHAG